MKVDRRLFLKALAFAGGGTLGFMSSPAPWHLIRDLARWTQNWPWVPVPPHGEPSLEKSVCGMCDGGCGTKVRKLGHRLVRIYGDEHHPVNRGLLCPRGTAELQMVYGPSRITQPLKRTGTHDDPKWEPLSWEEAIEEVAREIEQIRAANESHALACITNGCDRTVNRLFERFLHAVGSRNFVRMSSGRDARNMTLKLMQGVDGDMAYDFENARFILSFGCALLEGWGTWGRMYRAYASSLAESDSDRVEIVQVDSNLSTTASKASQWVPIKPGAEAALALGLAHVLIRDRLYDEEFVDKHCFGFEDWKGPDGETHKGFKSMVLASYSPQSVEQMTTVPAKEIESLAQKFATTRPALAVAGRGGGDLFSNLYELMAVHSLNALAGNINRPGGVGVKRQPPVAPLPPVVMDEEAARGYAVERLDEAGSATYPFSPSLPGNLKADGIKVLFIHEANPYYALPERETAEEIFEKVPFIVSFSCCMDESAAGANLVLPLPTSVERWDDQFAAPELPYPVYNVNRPLINPSYQTKNAGDILIALAKRLGGTIAESFPWTGMQTVLEMRAKGLHQAGRGMIASPESVAVKEKGRISAVSRPAKYPSFSSMWRELLENNCWFDPDLGRGSPEEVLKNPGGKFEFFSRQLTTAFHFTDDVKCMPHYNEPELSREGFDLMIMPEDMLLVADDGKDTPPFLIKQLSDRVLSKNELFVRINPITALYQNLQEGDTVILESPRGKVRVRLHTFEGVREGVVLIPLGFGHTAYDEFLRDKGVDARRILEAKSDPVSGLPVWWATPGKITRA